MSFLRLLQHTAPNWVAHTFAIHSLTFPEARNLQSVCCRATPLPEALWGFFPPFLASGAPGGPQPAAPSPQPHLEFLHLQRPCFQIKSTHRYQGQAINISFGGHSLTHNRKGPFAPRQIIKSHVHFINMQADKKMKAQI